MPEYYSVEWMDHILFVHWSTDVHSGYFYLSDCEQSCPPSCFEFIHLGIVIWEPHLRKPTFSDFSVPKVKPTHSGRWKHMPGPHLQILWLGRFGWAWKPSFSVRSHPSLSQLLVQMIKPLFCKKLKKRKSSMFELWVHFFPIFLNTCQCQIFNSEHVLYSKLF